MMKKALFVILLIAIFLRGSVFAQEQSAYPFKRGILALYKSSEGMSEESNDIFAMCEFPLNYLGLVVEYHDICKGLPNDEYMKDFRGIISFFYSSDMPNAKNYCDWLRKQIINGRKVVILANFGAFVDSINNVSVDEKEVNRLFHALGLDCEYEETGDKSNIVLTYKNSEMVEFERPISEDELIYYIKIKSIHPQSKVYLNLRRKDLPQSRSDMVAITPYGGLAYEPYLYHQDPISFKRQWHLNPFKFFSQAFEVGSSPRLDLSILNGNRIFFSHIDGDGFSTLSSLETDKFCSEIIRDRKSVV